MKREWGTCSAGEREADRERAGLRPYRETSRPLNTPHTSYYSFPTDKRSSMFWWSLPKTLCVLSVCVSLTLAYEDDFVVNYRDPFYNEITDGETPQRK